MTREVLYCTLGACDDRTTLVLTLLNHTVLTDGFGERTHAQVAHQHFVVAGAVQAWFVGQNTVAFCVVQVIVIAAM